MSSLIVRRRLQERRAHRSSGAAPWLVALVGLFAFGAIMAAAAAGALFGMYNSYAHDYVPIEEKLLQRAVGLTTIYDRGGPDSGVELGSLTNPDAQLLEPVPLEAISPFMVNATISTEDNSFWDNPGINFTGLARAAYENYVKNEFGGGTGGSSITQQLIKNVYICPSITNSDDPTRCVTAERTLDRKLREIVYAVELTRDYTKEEILTWYLNQISYADRYIGVEAASQGYFRKAAKDLTLGEAALLAGVPQFPTQYHPRYNCVRGDDEKCLLDALGRSTLAGEAKVRQEAVLDLMVIHGRATAEEAAAAKLEEIKVFAASNPLKAEAWIDNQVEPRLVRMCKAGLLPMPKGVEECTAWVHSAGYQVTSTLDWEATEAARVLSQTKIAEGQAAGCNCFNAAIVTIEPTTGEIIVYSPNVDPTYRSDERVAGNIDQLSEINQPGSSFKPAVYLNWFDTQNKAPMSFFWDTSPLAVEGTEITNPRNDGKVSEGLISARAALGGSQNVGAFRAAQEGGVDNVIETAKKLGITTLEQHFDPTFGNHQAVTYGASIATGGANIRAVDMAYMDATIANMGKMIGTKSYAEYVPLKDLKNTATDIGADYDTAVRQAIEFQRGNIRIPGTREIDPVVVLEVRDKDGGLVYREPDKRESKQTIDAGSVWLLHSIMSDCTARFIIWGCGGSNNDLGLDFYSGGVKIPSGVKTGTQQGPLKASDTLETWMTGYSRHAATAVWVGNANNELVNDRSFASANATVRLWKTWMGTYHELLASRGVTDIAQGFDGIRPGNVAQRSFESAATDRTVGPDFKYCEQTVTSWVRTDVKYDSQCEEKEIDTRNGFLATAETPAQFKEMKKFVKLPGFKPEPAKELAKERGIPIALIDKSTGQVALSIANLQTGRTISTTFQVTGTVNVPSVKNWKLEIGETAAPTEWKTIGSGSTNVTAEGPLGVIEPRDLKDNAVYTVRLSTDDGKGLKLSVVINIKRTNVPNNPFGSVTPTPNPNFPVGTVTPQVPRP
ncbi:transglycosylase domain-containing protein [Candidatus Amarobacter glycogenicus]|uniref:transglycosylase domain-containing protein n=1 Tax=Candidatus Amarobacter glycogenicus TaxID=3140699 RepID=UPI002A105985|nr:penicillin-binding protein [Dehalococcoidia bacterium]